MKTKRLFAILLAALMLLSLLPAGALAEEAAVKVSFACSPADAAVTLCPKGSGDAVAPEADGTYLLQTEDGAEIRGEAYRISDGIMTRISSEGDVYSL